MKKIVSGLLLTTLALTGVTPTADASKRVDDLMARMTLDEKIGQLNQLTGWGDNDAMKGQIRAGQVGSLLNEVDPVVVNKLQKVAVEESRLGIPLVFARDVIHGFKTIFPLPIGQASTWNPELVRQASAIAADEASSTGVRWTFSPMLDIARDARWGRIAEGYGEDPYLTSVMGVATVEGYQGDDLSNPSTMAACAKHFAGYGFVEGGLDYNASWIPDNLMHEVILPPFKQAVDAGAATVMSSFNDINGVPPSGNKWLLTDLLRKEWSFKGMTVSDWNSIGMMVLGGYAADLSDAAAKAISAGLDMDMESHAYLPNLKKLVEEGKVSMADIDSAVRYVLEFKERLGLFDNPYVDMKTANRFFSPGSLQAATRAVEESVILLKNEGNILPLERKNIKIAVVGPMADNRHDQNGTWSFDMVKDRTVTPLTSLREIYGDRNVSYTQALRHTRDRSTEDFADAVNAASEADVVIAFVGEEAVLSGEAHCRTDLTLPGAQSALLKVLHDTGKPVVAVYMTGRPMVITEDLPNCDAILYSYHPGTMGGPGLANIISGKANPSGHLPTVLARTTGQMPLYYGHRMTGRPAPENPILINDLELEAGQTSTGCTAFYLDAGFGPLFPFGYGLSYTTFSYDHPQLSASHMDKDGSLTATCRVTNTGSREGATVAQLYVRDIVGSTTRPVRELKGFEKITLKPGESREVSFKLTPADLAFWRNGAMTPEPGAFDLWITTDSASGDPVRFTLD